MNDRLQRGVDRIQHLTCFTNPTRIDPISGGITNQNFSVSDGGKRYFVRLGDDIPIHGVMRFNELNASLAAARSGISPPVVHHEPGVLVLEFIEGQTLSAENFRDFGNVEKAVALVRDCHDRIALNLRGPVLMFWVFHVVRDYLATIQESNHRLSDIVPALKADNEMLEQAVGPMTPVFSHNDLLPGNFILDEKRMWLIDWDYAGFNSPLFDLGGFCTNNNIAGAEEETAVNLYLGRGMDSAERKSFEALKCASLLRETAWSMVSEVHSQIDFDYVAYTATNLEHFQESKERFRSHFG
ncbi:MAG: choline kinase family protein [Pseudomonadota bacterium]